MEQVFVAHGQQLVIPCGHTQPACLFCEYRISSKNSAPKKLFLSGFAQYLEVKASAQRQMAE